MNSLSRIVGVRWREADPVIYVDAGDMELNQGNYVVLHTEKGQEFGWVVRQPRNLVLAQPEVDSSATVVRKGTASDFGRWQQLKETGDDALKLARSKARELQLTMKIVATPLYVRPQPDNRNLWCRGEGRFPAITARVGNRPAMPRRTQTDRRPGCSEAGRGNRTVRPGSLLLRVDDQIRRHRAPDGQGASPRPSAQTVWPGPVDGYGAARDSNTSNTAKSTVSCLVSAKRLEPPTVWPQL